MRHLVYCFLLLTIVLSCTSEDMVLLEKEYCKGANIVHIESDSDIDINIEPAVNGESCVLVIANSYIINKIGVRLDNSGLLSIWLDDGKIVGETSITIRVFANDISRIDVDNKSHVAVNSSALSTRETRLNVTNNSFLEVTGKQYEVESLDIDVDFSSGCKFLNELRPTKKFDIICTRGSLLSIDNLSNNAETSFIVENSSIVKITGTDYNIYNKQSLIVKDKGFYNSLAYNCVNLDCSIYNNSIAMVAVSDNIWGSVSNNSELSCRPNGSYLVVASMSVSPDSRFLLLDQ